MRKAIVCLCLILLGGLASASLAAAQTPPPISNRPAATLLLPYFEVDLDNPEGMTTLFSINNASATAVLARVTIWSDMGVPVFGFNVYLTGYDVQPINLRNVLIGNVPITASAGQDPQDRISNKGPVSQDINFASCTGQFPYPPVAAVYLPYLRSALTGGPSSFHEGMCVARNHGTPSVARGYVTVDTVNNCTLRFPGDPGYIGPGGTGDMTNQNVLFGDYQMIDTSQDLGFGEPLVAVTANPVDPDLSTPGNYTFYGRLTNWTAADNREPLGTNMDVRFLSAKDFKTVDKSRRRNTLPPGTELIVWRDPKVSAQNGFVCSGSPAWYPLSQEQIIAFDEQEHFEIPTFGTPPFPIATQRVPITDTTFPLTTFSGLLHLNLNTFVTGTGAPDDVNAAQAWVTVLHRVQQGPNGGRYDVGSRAVRLDSARDASHYVY
jgi:hypothetical protein